MGRSEFTFIDLFAGIGGFRRALESNGGNCIGFSEINKDAIQTYCRNYEVGFESNFGDITTIDQLPHHDVLTAGVPCQSWSIAGRNLGFDDDRGQLWNDTIYLLNQSKPKAFIFENVKGLVDPRNKKALAYILERIKKAGYHADFYVINSHDHGVAQNRVRIYIVGFLEKEYFDNFQVLKVHAVQKNLADILGRKQWKNSKVENGQKDLFGNSSEQRQMSLSSKNGFNDYFLFNDLRNGNTTIHSWDISDTTDKLKAICLLLLKNRRKSHFGPLDGNPLSLLQLQSLDRNITYDDLKELIDIEILKKVNYRFETLAFADEKRLTENEKELLSFSRASGLIIDELKVQRSLKLKRIPINATLDSLVIKGVLKCVEERYDFKNTKISSGLNGVNRIFMSTSDVFPTLVASDTNDYVSTEILHPTDHQDYKEQFLEKVYFANNYRKITKEEACEIQGFPTDLILPDSRARWMKLVGNSVSVPVIDVLIKSIVATGVFDVNEKITTGLLEGKSHRVHG